VLNEARALADDSCNLDIYDWMYNRETGFLRCMTGTIGVGSNCSGDGALDWIRYFTCIHPNVCRPTGRLASSSECHVMSAETQACRIDWDCATGLFCMGAGLTSDGTCQPQFHTDDFCERNYQCESLICAEATTSCAERDAETVWCDDIFALLGSLSD
jgi:hypothetical protein